MRGERQDGCAKTLYPCKMALTKKNLNPHFIRHRSKEEVQGTLPDTMARSNSQYSLTYSIYYGEASKKCNFNAVMNICATNDDSSVDNRIQNRKQYTTLIQLI
jgi:hypothetical protein